MSESTVSPSPPANRKKLTSSILRLIQEWKGGGLELLPFVNLFVE